MLFYISQFVSDLRHIGGFLLVRHDITERWLKIVNNTHNSNHAIPKINTWFTLSIIVTFDLW